MRAAGEVCYYSRSFSPPHSPPQPPMLWKLLLLAACAVAVWKITRPAPAPATSKKTSRQNSEDDQTQNLALCPKCGVYHHPDSPCQNTAPPNAKPS